MNWWLLLPYVIGWLVYIPFGARHMIRELSVNGRYDTSDILEGLALGVVSGAIWPCIVAFFAISTSAKYLCSRDSVRTLLIPADVQKGMRQNEIKELEREIKELEREKQKVLNG